MRDVVQIGPFRLHGTLAEGGMGVVWRGVHETCRVPVAVKVLAPHAWKRADLLEQFRNEVRAVARLDHPGIVMVLDHGTITAEASLASEGKLAVGSPYLVMEYASGGTLAELGRSLTWDELRSILLALLDALAHAHARGVVHRDLKPGNILLSTGTDPRPGVKLTDWGIAHAMNWARGRKLTERAGTLHFMAPEQVRGDWRDQGPWTDLYALGCVAYRLAGGRLPFAGLRGDALARAHVDETPPPLVPRMPVGGGFAAWVSCLMAKSPRDRFTRAADAARALLNLPDPPVRPRLLHETPSAAGSRIVIPGTTTLPPDVLLGDLGHSDPLVPSYGSGVAIPAEAYPSPRAEVPPDWRAPKPPPPDPALLGAGLGLWGLRSLPIVGREAERDALWASLRQASRTGGAHAVLLEGPSGMGKSALARWLSERTQEIGCATVIRAVQGEGESPDAGLRRALSRSLRVEGLRGEALRERLLQKVPRDEVDAVARVLAHSDADEHSPLARRLRARERRSTLIGILRRTGAGEPVVLVLEDVQWSHEAIALARDVIASQADQPFPILMVLTARSEALATRELEKQELDELAATGAMEARHLGPLPAEAHVQLIRSLLDLDESLVARIEQLTAGSPLFVIQLVDEWVRRGLLVPGETGLTLKAGAPELPDELHTTWARQAEEVLAGLPSIARLALERAAVLGAVVDSREWSALCQIDVDVGDDTDTRAARDVLRQRLITRRLAREEGPGLSFSHSLFREAVNRVSRERGRYRSHHAAVVKMLRERDRDPTGETAERIGLHALEAGDVDTALDLLLGAVEERRQRANYRAALTMVQQLQEAADRAMLADDDPRRAALALQTTVLHRLQGDYRGAAVRAEALREEAIRRGWRDTELAAMLELATVYIHTDRIAEGRALAEEVVRRSASAPEQRATALYIAAAGAGEARDYEAQDALHQQAAAAHLEIGDEVGWADSQRDRGNHALRRGELATAKALFEEALPVYERRNLRLGLAHTVNGLAEVARKEGRLDDAEAGYTRSIALFESIGGGQATVPMLNLGLIRLVQRDFPGARATVETALTRLQRQGRMGLVAAAHGLLLAPYAAAGDWADWDRAMAALRALLDETGIVAADLAWALELAAQVAAAVPDTRRARQARRLARRQYEQLGDLDAARRLVQPT